MKGFAHFLTWLVVVVVIVMISVGAYSVSYGYHSNVNSYLKLSDDASTAKLKLDYALQYKEAVGKYVTGEDARFIWKTPQLKVSAQKKTLDSLIDRLQSTAALPEGSLEYQQAMAQITGQEFQSAMDSIDSVFYATYIRQSGWWGWAWANGLLAFLLSAILVIIGVGVSVFVEDRY